MDLSSITSLTAKLELLGASSWQPPWAVDLKAVQRMLARIQAVLKDAEEREIYDASVRLWLKDLKAVAYEADDVLDEYEYELLRVNAEADNQIQNAEAATYLPCKRTHKEVGDLMMASPNTLNASSFWLKVAGRIRKIHQELGEISKLRDTLYLREEDGQRRPRSTTMRQPSSHLVDSANPRGRKDDLEKVMGMLLSDECSRSDLFVIPIVGIGGVGKTTFVQLLYNNSEVRELFHLHGWVCVSDDFELVQLTTKIIEAFSRAQANLSELSVLQDRLMAEIRGKRFLLVLDDVWEESLDLWNKLLLPLKQGEQGSAVIITTRNQKIATYVAPTHPHHHLDCLSKEDCWEVFKQNAFHGQASHESTFVELAEIGKQIAEKCKGLPLAAKSLGCLLSGDNDVETWKDVLESHVWEVDDNNIIPALGLSYVRLPCHLKQCFLYTSLFPKDFNFVKDELVRLWMAQGYIRHSGKRDLENAGSRYFDDLVKRSFFQKHPHYSGRFVMHDLIHDLAQFISHGEHAVLEMGKAKTSTVRQARHISVKIQHYSSDCDLLCRAPETVRTILLISLCHPVLSVGQFQQGSEFIIEHMLNLRILCFEDVNLQYLPEAIGNLKHLRYLRLEGSEFRELPDSVGKLYYLQTLMIRNTMVEMLPRSITNLANLRCLQVHGECTRMPKGIGKLTSLRLLNVLVLGRANEDCAGVEELKDLTHLRGNLSIRDLRCLVDAGKAKEADLEGKTMISELHLNWYCDFEIYSLEQCISYDQRKMVLENLRPHCGLEKLRIDGYGGLVFPEWLGDPRFLSLTSVEIENCRELAALPSFGLLPSLKSLDIQGECAVAVVGSEFCGQDTVGFPALEQLTFSGMSQWRLWYGVRSRDFPCLQRLELNNCCLLRQMVPLYLLPSLEELYLGSCSALASIELWSPSSSFPSSSSTWPPPLLKVMHIMDCPLARFTPEDSDRLLLPPTLHDLYIDMGCPLLVEWFLQTVAGIKSLSTIKAAQLWKLMPGGRMFVSTKDEGYRAVGASQRLWEKNILNNAPHQAD